jgi:hypothetical protein
MPNKTTETAERFMKRIALGLARRFGNTPAWGVALRIVDRAQDHVRDLWLFLYDHDGQRLAREAVRKKEIDEAAKKALAELDALVATVTSEAEVTTTAEVEAKRAADGAAGERLVEAGRALGLKIIDEVRLRSATGKRGRN